MASNSYPRKLKLFLAWTKAMTAGATVDKPSYSLARAQPKTSTKLRRARKGPRRTSRKRPARRRERAD